MSAINFAIKEKFQDYLVSKDPSASKFKVLLGQIMAGGLSGSIALYCVYPLDLARTRLSTDVMNSSKN